MRIALAQINSTSKVEQNLAKLKTYAAQAAKQDADIVVFPEATMVAFGSDLARAADAHSETWSHELSNLAAEYRLTIVVGEFERVDDKVTNYLSAYSPDRQVERYAKIHLYDAFGYKESEAVVAGDRPTLIDVGGIYMGLATCYDIRFPKLFAELSRRGAALTILSASWGAGDGKIDQWRTLAQARALDSNAYVIAVDQADPEISGVNVPNNGPTGVGHSIVADPFGRIVAQLGGEEALSVVEVDPVLSEKAARIIPVLSNAKLGY